MGGNGKKIDLSGGSGRRRAPPAKRVKTEAEEEARAAASRGKAQIELDLGLSTNGQFGVDPARARKLERSASGYGPSGAVARGDHAPPIRTTSVPPGFGGREEGRRGDPSGKGKAPMVYSPEGRELNGDAGANQNNMTRSSSIPQASPAAANSLSEKQKLLTNALLNMPYVTLTGARLNNIHVEGILYRYRKAEELKIVCVCHGLFLTPAEFVKHGGGGDVDDPLKYIVVNPTPIFPV